MNYRDGNQSIEDFAEMTTRYNTTKPVVSKNHTREDNIRPVGDRRRKWEHMIKVSAYKYILYDGYCAGDPKFNAWGNKVSPTEKETLALAPIVWTLSPKGDIETIRIRNGSGFYGHNARYTFLENTLPQGLRFIVYNGKQYIETGKNKQEYLLPKSRYNPFYSPNGYNAKWFSDKDDKPYLTFARKVGGDRYSWEVIGDTWDVRGARKQVNKKAKAEIKPYADAFYKWVATMYRLIPFTDHDYESKHRVELGEWAVEQGLIRNKWELNSVSNSENSKSAMAIIADGVFRNDQHPMRLHLAIDFLSQSNLNAHRYGWGGDNNIREPETKEDVSRLRAQWNRYVNSKLNLVKELEVEKIVKGGK
jgi:hypothetical protein